MCCDVTPVHPIRDLLSSPSTSIPSHFHARRCQNQDQVPQWSAHHDRPTSYPCKDLRWFSDGWCHSLELPNADLTQYLWPFDYTDFANDRHSKIHVHVSLYQPHLHPHQLPGDLLGLSQNNGPLDGNHHSHTPTSVPTSHPWLPPYTQSVISKICMISIPGGGKCDELPVTPCVHRDLTSPFLVIEFMHVSIIVQLTLYISILQISYTVVII